MRRRPPGRLDLTVAVLGALAGLIAVPASALEPSRPLSHYGLDAWRTTDGLPQNSVQAILQTGDGYLWVGTVEGLARFDGLAFTTFDTSNSAIRRNDITCLQEDRAGALWVGTFHGGLTRHFRGEFRTYGTADGLSSEDVNAIAEGPDGTLWVGTSDAGLNRLVDGVVTARYRAGPDGLPDDSVRSLRASRDGTLWIGTEAGLARFRAGRFTVYRKADGLPEDFVTALAEDGAGGLWVGTAAGLARWDGRRFTTYALGAGLPNANVHALHVDRAGHVWIGTDGGLTRFRDGRFEVLTNEDGLTQDVVLALASDREGSLWIGTDGGGLNRVKDAKIVTLRSADPGWLENITTVAPDGQGGLWSGGPGGQVSRLSQGTIRALPSVAALKRGHIRALESHGDALWIGSDHGLYVHRGGTFEPFGARVGLPEGAVRALLHDRAGTFWVGTDGAGVARLVNGRFVLLGESEGLAGNRVRFLHEDRKGRLWIGCYGGLSLWEGGRFVNFGPEQGLTDTLVRSVHEDSSGVMWIGTYGGGLFRFADGRFVRFGGKEGLPSEIIYGISEDRGGHLWMSCNKGVFRVSKRELDAVAAGRAARVQATIFGVDEMKGNECNGGNPAVVRMADGTLWFPTLKGVARVDPERLPHNGVPPAVVIEGLTVNGRPAGEPARLAAGRQNLEFRYAALSFLAPGRVSVAYKLEGFDGEWIDAGRRRVAYYTNLPPGPYTFRVTATNEDGVANEAGASFSLYQDARLHQRPAFWLAVALGAVLLGYGAYRARTAQLRAHERELEGRVAAALADVKVLSGLLPVCASCKKIRDDKGYWTQIESYIRDHSEADFSHGICPECLTRLYPQQAARILGKGGTPTG
jgi:ligand-binding sensor domain-containing protein